MSAFNTIYAWYRISIYCDIDISKHSIRHPTRVFTAFATLAALRDKAELTTAPRPYPPKTHLPSHPALHCTHRRLLPPRTAEGNATQQHLSDVRGIGGGELQRGWIPSLQEGSRSERGQVAAEADKRQQLGLRAIPEPVLRGIMSCHI